MAMDFWSNPAEVVNFPTDVLSLAPTGDMEAKELHFVKMGGDATVTAITDTADLAVGVLKNQPVATTGPRLVALVQVRGVARVAVGTGGLVAGDLVTNDNAGKGIKLAPEEGGAFAYGVCLYGGAKDLTASVRLFDGPCWIPKPAGGG